MEEEENEEKEREDFEEEQEEEQGENQGGEDEQKEEKGDCEKDEVMERNHLMKFVLQLESVAYIEGLLKNHKDLVEDLNFKLTKEIETMTMKLKIKRIFYFRTRKEFRGQLKNLRKEEIITLTIVIKKRLKH